ncbi:MAG: mechanosensitive ion channel family protein [Candidatus Eremiobacteraeota bacterium]|nr:mechanosensitive ion channel family protein [Candidatus Eremiobacteraeota bacterium]
MNIIKDSEGWLSTWFGDPTVTKLIVLAVGLLVIQFTVKLAHRAVNRQLENAEAARTTKRLLTMLGYVVALVLVTSVFRDKLGGITVAFGVAGAGIAFALQEVIASVAGWIAISLGGFYKVGDRVLLGGIKGDVINIGVLRTTMMELGDWVKGDLYNGRIVRVANSFVFKEPVYNYSGDFPFLWDELTVPIKYGCDWKLFEQVLADVAQEVVGDYATEAEKSWKQMVKNYAIENAMVEPMISLVANDNWIEFTLRYVVDFKRRRGTRSLLFRRILEEIDRRPEQLAIASATFHLVEAPTLTVNLAQKDG